VLWGMISGQKIDDEAFVGVDRGPPVAVVKNLVLEFFKNPFNTGIQVQRAEGCICTTGQLFPKGHRVRGCPAAMNDGLVKHQFLKFILVEWRVHLYKFV